MKSTKVEGLCNCPKCGSDNVFLISNALHRFQVRCLDCGLKSRYNRKAETIIDWYNMVLASRGITLKRGRGRPRLN